MELRQILNLIGRWAWLIILSVVIAAGSSYLASRAATPLYRTKTTLMVGRAMQNPEASSAELYTGQQLAYTYSQLSRREPVLNGAIQSLGLQMSWEALAEQVSTSSVQQTQLLEISVIDSDPYRAKVLADAIAQQLILQSPAGAGSASEEDLAFIKGQLGELQSKIEAGQDEVEQLRQEMDASNSALQIQDLQNRIDVLETKISGWQDTYSQLLASLQGGNVNALSVVEKATIPTSPISPNVKMNVLVAAAIGLVLALGGVFLMEYLDDTLRTSDDVIRATNLPALGAIAPLPGKSHTEKLVAASKPLDPTVEAFRALRASIQYSSVGRPLRSLLVTSAGPGEGKSICLANLAVVMAQAGLKVILVDADFRRPVLNELFNLPNASGLSNAIQDNVPTVGSFLTDTGIQNLQVLLSGPIPPNPDNLLESGRIEEFLVELKARADIILFDSPPVLVVADAAILGTQVDGVLLVVDSGRTRLNEARHAADLLRRLNVNLLGTILNRSTEQRDQHYYYYYHHKENGHNGQKKGGNLQNHSIETIFNGRSQGKEKTRGLRGGKS